LWGLPFLFFVIAVGLYFTFGSGLFTVAHFNHIMKNTIGSVIGKNKEKKNTNAGQVSSFEAVCIAIGGCVGCGNIGGVATAIAVGGPGAVFWMWLWAICGMMVKMVETALGCHYRSKNERGEYFGGSTYFMEKGIGREMGIKAGYGLAFAFGIGFVAQFLGGSQAYTISEVINKSFGVNMILSTLIYSAILFYIIWKGTPRVAKFATRAVPFMTTLFIIGGLGVIIANIQNVPSVFVAIFHDAFTGTAAVGGFTGAGISLVMRSGVARSINSNEAGQGSSPFIHGSANTIHPIRQGLWGSFEVFADTVIVCSITALAILCAGEWVTGQAGATLTIISYESVYGRFGSVFIGIMCGLFGITTTAGWYTYYVAVINHALRYKPIARDKVLKIFKFVFPLPNIIIVSSIVLTGNGPELFWTIVDITLVVPVFTNLLALVVLRKKFWELLKDYKARHMGIGTVDPNFNVFYEDDPKIAEEEEKIREKMRLISKKAYNKA
jgi:AGCS family alanine or glycine:cation symporter